MKQIRELSEVLANQIAAGEVVERPASVVKELVENAVDAQSTQIDILLEEAGLKKITVIDNGLGIYDEDVIDAFKRHATSKIQTQQDLFRIQTLGFRGEALPSIASVSKVTVETSTGKEGSYVALKGGEVVEHRPHSLRQGTKIVVADLFFNTPARLKYVKTLQTELANVVDIVQRVAMSHPEIAFRLVHDGNALFRTSGNGDLKQAIAGIYGVSTVKKMIHVEAEDLDFQLSGYISLPELTRASRKYMTVLINGRYIKNFTLNKAITNGYRSKLMIGRFPIAVLKIEMDPLLVDVNVHPTKQEVRLSKEKELETLIETAIHQALSEEVLIPSVPGATMQEKKQVVSSRPPVSPIPNTMPEKKDEPKAKETTLKFDPVRHQFFVNEPTVAVKDDKEQAHINPHEYINELSDVESEKLRHPFGKQETESLVDIEPEKAKQTFPELEYFGQMHGTYLFAQSEQGLYIIDQHAAQERIKYEYYRDKIGEVSEDRQHLLLPLVLEYPYQDLVTFQEKKPLLEAVGLYLEPFGKNSVIIREHPTWFPEGQEEAVIRDMLDYLLKHGNISIAKFREEQAIMMSCKKSIKANHHLSDAQARQLLLDLKMCQNPFNCPHGRPVLVHFTPHEMERMFKRIQDSH